MCRILAYSLLVWPLLLSAACDRPQESSGAGIVVDTLPGGTVLVDNPSEGLWEQTGEDWRPVEELRIGGADGEGPEVFGQIRDLVVDDAGRTHTLDSQAREVRVFDGDGRHLRTLGGPGEGPGELADPNGLAVDPRGRLWVSDPANGRYSVFDGDGTFVESHTRRVGGFGFWWEGTFDDEGRLLDPSRAGDPTGSGTRRHLVRHELRHGELVQVDSVPMPPEGAVTEPAAVEIPLESDGHQFVSIPFIPQAVWTVGPGGRLLFGAGDSYRIHERALAGDTLRTVRRSRSPDPVTREDVEAAVDAHRDDVPDRALRGLEEAIPETRPHFETLFTDDAGYLWVGRATAGEGTEGDQGDRSTFDVFDPEGRFLGEVRLGVALTPTPEVAGSRVVGVHQDALGVPHVVVYRLNGR